jgi:hypothetical protein
VGEEKGVGSGGGEIKERRAWEMLACERHATLTKKLRRNLLATGDKPTRDQCAAGQAI